MAKLNRSLALKGTQVWSIQPANSVYQTIQIVRLYAVSKQSI